MSTWIFYPLALLTVVSALGVVLNRNPVRSALSLVATLFLIAVFYAALQAHLVAALQVIVYAGAVMVLFLFVITLLNLQNDPDDAGSPLTMAAAFVTATAVAGVIGAAVWTASLPAGAERPLAEAFGTTVELARQLFREYLVAFELTSIMLLVAVVGAVVLSKRDEPRALAETTPPAQGQNP